MDALSLKLWILFLLSNFSFLVEGIQKPRLLIYGDEIVNLLNPPFDYVELHLINLIRSLRITRSVDISFLSYKFGSLRNRNTTAAIGDPRVIGAIIFSSCPTTHLFFDDLKKIKKSRRLLRVDLAPCVVRESEKVNTAVVLKAHPIPFEKRFHCLAMGILKWVDEVLMEYEHDARFQRFFSPVKLNNTSLQTTMEECAGKVWNETFIGTITHLSHVNSSVAKKLLSGSRLTISAVNRPPWISVKRDAAREINDVSGYSVDLLKILANRLNFTYDIILPKDNECGALEGNGTWTGMLGHLARLEADLAIGPIAMIGDRREAADFPATIYEELAILIVPPPREMDNYFLYLLPLTREVWLCSFGAAILMALSLWLTMFCLQKANREKWEISMASALMECIGASSGQTGLIMPRYMTSGIIIAIWLLTIVPIFYGYNGALVSFLTVMKLETPVTTLSELVKSSLDCVVRKGTSVETFLLDANFGVFQQLGDSLRANPNNSLTSERAALDKVIDGHAVYLKEYVSAIASITADYKNASYCRMALGKEEFLKTHVAFAVPKGSFYFSIMRTELLKLQGAGILKYWQNYHWPLPNGCISRIPPTLAERRLRNADFCVAYIVSAIGITLSVLTFGCERLNLHHTPHTI